MFTGTTLRTRKSRFDITPDQLNKEEEDIDGVPYIEENLIPNRPYYNLPAALMIDQIPMENCTFKPISPKSLRLPPIMKPSQKIIGALEAFDHPLLTDSLGWGLNALTDYYAKKQNVKMIMEEKLQSEGKKFEDIIENKMTSEDLKLQMDDRR